MTTDFENELRDLLREKAGEAPLATPTLPASAPKQVLRRGRLHQAGTVLGSAVVVVALIVGSVAGLTRILGEGPDQVETANYDVFHRTATVEAFTVGSPSDWYLVNQWPLSMLIAVQGSGGASSPCIAEPGSANQECETAPGVETSSPIPVPHGLPMIQLSNVDLGLTTNACEHGLPPGAAVLYVALDHDAAIGGVANPSIQEFPPGIGLPPEGDGPCGPGRYAYFTVNGERFFSWIGVGSAVSDEDRETVETSYEMMSAIPDWTPTPPDVTAPAYVIAAGALGNGETWRLDLRPGDRSPELFLDGVDQSLLGVEPGRGQDTVVPSIPIEYCCGWSEGFLDVTFGFVRRDAEGVEMRVTDSIGEPTGQTLEATIVPIPPSLAAIDADLFFIEGTGGLVGEVFALGVDEPSASPSPLPSAQADIVELSGPYGAHTWIVGFSGSFADETACVRVNVDGVDLAPLCPTRLEDALASDQPSLHAWLTDDFYLLAGAVPANVDDIRFTSDDGTDPRRELQCGPAPVGWSDPARRVCVIALPPEGGGTFEYLDADGVVLSEDGMGWGTAEPDPSEYPWTNEDATITAQGSFQGAEWQLQVLHYLDGYRLTIDGREIFEGRPFGLGEARTFPLFQGDRSQNDALVFVLTTSGETSASIVSGDDTWEGRWIPGSTVSGGEGRLWVFELPGAGIGSYYLDGESLQGEVRWP